MSLQYEPFSELLHISAGVKPDEPSRWSRQQHPDAFEQQPDGSEHESEQQPDESEQHQPDESAPWSRQQHPLPLLLDYSPS